MENKTAAAQREEGSWKDGGVGVNLGGWETKQWPSGEDRVPFLFLGSNPKSKSCG